MSAVQAAPGRVTVAGDMTAVSAQEFERALDVLRHSQTKVPVVDLTDVTYVSSRHIGLLVTLWIDLFDEGRWFELRASDRVWAILEKAGIARAFFQRPR